MQRLVCCNLDERHELAVLVVADGSRVIPAAVATLTPLLGNVLNGTSKTPANAVETIATACKNAGAAVAAIAVIWDGQISLDGVGDFPIYHHSGGRLTRLRRGSLKLATGDWLVLACAALPDEGVVQAEIAAARSSAVELAQRLAERAGSNDSPIILVRGY